MTVHPLLGTFRRVSWSPLKVEVMIKEEERRTNATRRNVLATIVPLLQRRFALPF
jgi:hypothetical protein